MTGRLMEASPSTSVVTDYKIWACNGERISISGSVNSSQAIFRVALIDQSTIKPAQLVWGLCSMCGCACARMVIYPCCFMR